MATSIAASPSSRGRSVEQRRPDSSLHGDGTQRPFACTGEGIRVFAGDNECCSMLAVAGELGAEFYKERDDYVFLSRVRSLSSLQFDAVGVLTRQFQESYMTCRS